MSELTQSEVNAMSAIPDARSVAWRAILDRVLNARLFSIADQVLVSATNFLTTVIIGRAVGQDALGAYTLAFSVMLIVLCVQESLVCLPYVIEHRRLPDVERRRFAGSASMQAAMLAAAVLAVLLLGAYVLWARGDSNAATLALAFAFAMPFVLLRDFARRMSFARLAVRGAIMVDGAVLALQLGMLLLLWRLEWLTAATCWLVIAAACGVAAVLWIGFFRTDFHLPKGRLSADISRGWKLGRWVFGSQIISVLSSYLVYWLVAEHLGQAASGVLAACSAIVMLSNPITLGTYMYLPPRLAQALAEEGDRGLYRVALGSMGFLAGVLSVFTLAAFLLGDVFLRTVYGPSFSGHAVVTGLYGLTTLAFAVSAVPDQALWVKQRPQISFWTGLFGLVSMSVIALCLMPYAGLVGAVCAMTIGSGLAAAARWTALHRLTRRETNAVHHAEAKIEAIPAREPAV
jgi:O-antigen/teichoic acid export membrane protein